MNRRPGWPPAVFALDESAYFNLSVRFSLLVDAIYYLSPPQQSSVCEQGCSNQRNLISVTRTMPPLNCGSRPQCLS